MRGIWIVVGSVLAWCASGGGSLALDLASMVGKRVHAITPMALNEQCVDITVSDNGRWVKEPFCFPMGIGNETIAYFTKDGSALFFMETKDGAQGIQLSAKGGKGEYRTGSLLWRITYRPTGTGMRVVTEIVDTDDDTFSINRKVESTINITGDGCTIKSRVSGKLGAKSTPRMKYYSKGRTRITGPETCGVFEGPGPLANR